MRVPSTKTILSFGIGTSYPVTRQRSSSKSLSRHIVRCERELNDHVSSYSKTSCCNTINILFSDLGLPLSTRRRPLLLLLRCLRHLFDKPAHFQPPCSSVCQASLLLLLPQISDSLFRVGAAQFLEGEFDFASPDLVSCSESVHQLENMRPYSYTSGILT